MFCNTSLIASVKPMFLLFNLHFLQFFIIRYKKIAYTKVGKIYCLPVKYLRCVHNEGIHAPTCASPPRRFRIACASFSLKRVRARSCACVRVRVRALHVNNRCNVNFFKYNNKIFIIKYF